MYCVTKIDHFGHQKFLTPAGNWTKQPTEAWQFQAWTSAAIASEKCGGDVSLMVATREPSRAGNTAVAMLLPLVAVSILFLTLFNCKPLAQSIGEFSSPQRWAERIAR